MNREQLAHILRASSAISGERDVLVIGSQSILGAFSEHDLPSEATASIDADITFLDDSGDLKADLVDGAIGELSGFHETFGIYAQGVSVTTATLPDGWRDRLILLDRADTAPGRSLCLEPHDCVIAKLVAGREKDLVFASALVTAGLIDLDVLESRLEATPAQPLIIDRIRGWINAHRCR